MKTKKKTNRAELEVFRGSLGALDVTQGNLPVRPEGAKEVPFAAIQLSSTMLLKRRGIKILNSFFFSKQKEQIKIIRIKTPY